MKKYRRALTYLTLMLTCFLISACQQTSDSNRNRGTSVLGLGPYQKGLWTCLLSKLQMTYGTV